MKLFWMRWMAALATSGEDYAFCSAVGCCGAAGYGVCYSRTCSASGVKMTKKVTMRARAEARIGG